MLLIHFQALLIATSVAHVGGLMVTPSIPLFPPPVNITSPFNTTHLHLPSNSLTTPPDPSFWYQESDTIVTEYYAYRTYSPEIIPILSYLVIEAYFEAAFRIDIGDGDQPVGVSEREWRYGARVAHLKVEPGAQMTWMMLYEMLNDVVPFWKAKRWTGGFRFQVWTRKEAELVGKGELLANVESAEFRA